MSARRLSIAHSALTPLRRREPTQCRESRIVGSSASLAEPPVFFSIKSLLDRSRPDFVSNVDVHTSSIARDIWMLGLVFLSTHIVGHTSFDIVVQVLN